MTAKNPDTQSGQTSTHAPSQEGHAAGPAESGLLNALHNFMVLTESGTETGLHQMGTVIGRASWYERLTVCRQNAQRIIEQRGEAAQDHRIGTIERNPSNAQSSPPQSSAGQEGQSLESSRAEHQVRGQAEPVRALDQNADGHEANQKAGTVHERPAVGVDIPVPSAPEPLSKGGDANGTMQDLQQPRSLDIHTSSDNAVKGAAHPENAELPPEIVLKVIVAIVDEIPFVTLAAKSQLIFKLESLARLAIACERERTIRVAGAVREECKILIRRKGHSLTDEYCHGDGGRDGYIWESREAEWQLIILDELYEEFRTLDLARIVRETK